MIVVIINRFIGMKIEFLKLVQPIAGFILLFLSAIE